MPPARQFSITIMGVKHAATRLDELGKRADNIQTPLRQIYYQVLDLIEQTFQAQGMGRWAPVTFNWRDFKARHGLQPEIGYASGAMVSGLTRAKGQGHTVRFTKYAMEYVPGPTPPAGYSRGKARSFTERAKVFHEGHGEQEPRPIVRFTRRDQKDFAQTIVNHIMKPPPPSPIDVVTVPAFGGASVGRGAGGRFVSMRR